MSRRVRGQGLRKIEILEDDIVETDITVGNIGKSAVTVIRHPVFVDITRKNGRIQVWVAKAQVIILRSLAIAAPDAANITGNRLVGVLGSNQILSLLNMEGRI